MAYSFKMFKIMADYKTNLNYKSSGWFFCAIYTKMEKRERGVKG